MKLLLDMGNSRLKWAVYEQGQMLVGSSLPNPQISQSALFALWQDLPAPSQIAVACVGKPRVLAEVQTATTALWPASPVMLAASQVQAFGVSNAYPQAEKLGVDRWLALLAAHRHYPGACTIVDCGTAITVDFLAADGLHQGGWICPGLALMKSALAQGTEQLPFADGDYQLQAANNTEMAIANGVLAATVGLISQAACRPNLTQLLLTGGDAEVIAAHLPLAYQLDANLVFKGLAITLGDQ
jgi:type III pantothenate kinase